MRPTVAISAIAILAILLLVSPVVSAISPVAMRTASDFAVLAGGGITNTGASYVTGDVGSYPTLDQTGFGGANTVTLVGTNHFGDPVTQAARGDMVSAYNEAAGRPGATFLVGGDLGGRTLAPGVYADNNDPDSLAITGQVVLDGNGDPDSVFIFQSGSTFITAPNSNLILANGAQACNVFWQVSSSATLGTGSHLAGTILSWSSITMNHGATLDGRALANVGSVTMDSNTIRASSCTPAPPPLPQPQSCNPATVTFNVTMGPAQAVGASVNVTLPNGFTFAGSPPFGDFQSAGPAIGRNRVFNDTVGPQFGGNLTFQVNAPHSGIVTAKSVYMFDGSPSTSAPVDLEDQSIDCPVQGSDPSVTTSGQPTPSQAHTGTTSTTTTTTATPVFPSSIGIVVALVGALVGSFLIFGRKL